MKKTFEGLKDSINSIEEDVQKALSGNKAAITRVRKVAFEIKQAAHSLRKEALDCKPAKAAAAPVTAKAEKVKK